MSTCPFSEELTCNEVAMHFSGRNPTQITSAHVGPPTSGSKAGGPKSSGASGAATESGGGTQCVELELRWQFCVHGSTCPEIYF